MFHRSNAEILAEQDASIVTFACGCQESRPELIGCPAWERDAVAKEECRPCEVKRVRAERAARRGN